MLGHVLQAQVNPRLHEGEQEGWGFLGSFGVMARL